MSWTFEKHVRVTGKRLGFARSGRQGSLVADSKYAECKNRENNITFVILKYTKALIQCFDTVGWVTGRTLGHQVSRINISKGSL